MVLVTIFLVGAVFAGISNALEPNPATSITVQNLQNVRDYVPASSVDGVSYAVDAGTLYASSENGWQRVDTPANVIVNTVSVDSQKPGTLYIGAANEMAIYLSGDNGETWMRIPLDTQAVGSITDIAVDSAHRLVYVGTDTDGMHRLRDVGSSMVAAGHLILNEPVQEVVADSSGAGMAFVRTEWALYRAQDFGLTWLAVEDLPSPATAVAIANTTPPTAYVGTASSGVRMSNDGIHWQPANEGLGFTPGAQLYVNDVAVDPARPDVLYTATSFTFGSANARTTPVGVSMSTDSGQSWRELAPMSDVAVVDLLPVTGKAGAVYALTASSRTPLALGNAPTIQPVAATSAQTANAPGFDLGEIVAWILAGLAAITFLFILVLDLTQRREGIGKLAAKRVRNNH